MIEKNDLDISNTNKAIKKEADTFLFDLGLHELIKKHGDYFIAGSYDYDLMVWRDLDLYVDSSKISLSTIYTLIEEINCKYKPFWFKNDYELDKQKKYSNWLKDCLKRNPEYRTFILKIKSEIYKNSDYGKKYFSIDVYKSVIEGNVKNTTEFYAWYNRDKK